MAQRIQWIGRLTIPFQTYVCIRLEQNDLIGGVHKLPLSIKCFTRAAAGTREERLLARFLSECRGRCWREYLATHTRRRHAALVDESSRRRLNLLTTSNGQAAA
jgi:hypothetical protein